MKEPRPIEAVVAAAFALLIAVVGGTGDHQSIALSETDPGPDAELAAAIATVEKQLPGWVRAWREIDPHFDLRNFRNGHKSGIQPAEGVPGPSDEDRLRELIYVYSPDRTRFVDPYTGMELWEEDGRVVAGFDIDSEVVIVDLSAGTRRQILFCGTLCTFEDVAWIDNDRFVVVGSATYWPEDRPAECPEPSEEGSKRSCVAPSLYLIDLSTNTMSGYSGPIIKGSTERYYGGYLRARFPKITFR